MIVSDQMKDKTIIAHRVVFRSPKQNDIRVATQEEIDKEPLNEECIEFRQRFGQVGTFKFICTFMNDSYVGFDKEIPLEFDVVADDPSRVIPEYDDEDIEAIKAPGMLQSMLDVQIEEDSSEDEKEEEEEVKKSDDDAKPKSVAQSKSDKPTS